MKKILSLIVLLNFLAVSLFATGSLSDNLTTPHTFTSGDTISSSKINENFNKIFEELNKMQKHIYSYGNPLAEFISFKNSYALGKTAQGFFVQVSLTNGEIYGFYTGAPGGGDIKFLSTDCSGDMFVTSNILPQEVFGFTTWNNDTSRNDFDLYYTGNEYTYGIFKSEKKSPDVNATCNDGSWNTSEHSLLKIYQNDSNITGISSVPLPTPITIK